MKLRPELSTSPFPIYPIKHEQKEKDLMKLPFANYWRITTLVVLLALALVCCGTQGSNSNGQLSVLLGYFPNLTHAAALVSVERVTIHYALGTHIMPVPKI